jgi:hypothetical protein
MSRVGETARDRGVGHDPRTDPRGDSVGAGGTDSTRVWRGGLEIQSAIHAGVDRLDENLAARAVSLLSRSASAEGGTDGTG